MALDPNIPLAVRGFNLGELAQPIQQQQDRKVQQKAAEVAETRAAGADQRAIAADKRATEAHDADLEAKRLESVKMRRELLGTIFSQEADILESLPPEKRGTYYSEYLKKSLAEDGFDVSDLPEYSDELLPTFRNFGLSPEDREKKKLEAGLEAEWEKVKPQIDAYVGGKNGKLLASDINRLNRMIPPSLADYAPAKQYFGNFKTETPPKEPKSGDASPAFERSLQKDFKADPVTKSFLDISNKFGSMETIWNDYWGKVQRGEKPPKGIVDQALITLFGKITDPGSVVRESEYARTPAGMAAIARIQEIIPKLQQGGAGISDAYRKEILDVSRHLYKMSEDTFGDVVDDYIANATAWGADPERIVGSFGKYSRKAKGATDKADPAEVEMVWDPKSKSYVPKGGN